MMSRACRRRGDRRKRMVVVPVAVQNEGLEQRRSLRLDLLEGAFRQQGHGRLLLEAAALLVHSLERIQAMKQRCRFLSSWSRSRCCCRSPCCKERMLVVHEVMVSERIRISRKSSDRGRRTWEVSAGTPGHRGSCRHHCRSGHGDGGAGVVDAASHCRQRVGRRMMELPGLIVLVLAQCGGGEERRGGRGREHERILVDHRAALVSTKKWRRRSRSSGACAGRDLPGCDAGGIDWESPKG
mmetsp:Transcript_18339/g.52361  ORF Transcript_18339/g.52361 Transcript_18339/m.52361 type:complete len:240 (-) Transcript_18339:1200-1919(-)